MKKQHKQARALAWVAIAATALAVVACGGKTDDDGADGSGGGSGGGGSGGGSGAAAALADTGISATQCYKAGSTELVSCTSAEALALSSKQDGMLGLDVTAPDDSDGRLGLRYTKVDASGASMSKTAIGWKCVRDERTGLLWEGKTDDGTLHDKDNRYTHLGNNLDGDVSKYVTDVNAAGLCGRKDWRLPTASELQGIVHYGVDIGSGPTVDAAWFTNTEVNTQVYWAAEGVGNSTDRVWGIEFVLGDVLPFDRSFAGHVRLVAGAQASNTGRFVASADGSEVTDTLTKLIWRRCQEGSTWNGNDACSDGPIAGYAFTHEDALARAATVASAQGKAWRMPNVRELSSLIDRSRTSGLFIDPDAFPQARGGWFWTSTPVIRGGVSTNARSLYFDSGSVQSDGRDGLGQLRLVRDAS